MHSLEKMFVLFSHSTLYLLDRKKKFVSPEGRPVAVMFVYYYEEFPIGEIDPAEIIDKIRPGESPRPSSLIDDPCEEFSASEVPIISARILSSLLKGRYLILLST